MLAAFEAQLKRSAKDDAAWRRTESLLRAEPKEVREERRRSVAAGRPVLPAGGGMTVDDAEALLARFAASDAMFG